MIRYAVQRILLLVPLLAGLSFVIFMYLRLLPGDPIATMLGPGASPDLIANLRHEFGLDQPLLTQYVRWVEGLTRGDLGVTFGERQPIAPMLINRVPATLQLTIGGLVCAVAIGLPLGFIAGLRKDSKLDKFLSIAALVGLSTPAFWLGTILILVVAVNLHWLPSAGYAPLLTDPVASLKYMFMPSLVIGIAHAPYLARMTRAATVEVQQEPFIAFAAGRGLRPRTIIGRYSFRNAIVPVVIVLSLQLGGLLGGVFVVETLFSWPGLGRLMVNGISQRDYFMVQAILLVVAVIMVVLNLIAELLHAWLDPRIRLN